jgi:hypothetical protein
VTGVTTTVAQRLDDWHGAAASDERFAWAVPDAETAIIVSAIASDRHRRIPHTPVDRRIVPPAVAEYKACAGYGRSNPAARRA